jgi:SAM-dependent methyltransferase
VGDATQLRSDLGKFDVVMMANLIDRVPDPRKLLKQMPALLNRGGQLILTSPYTWLREYTPRANWLGGFKRGGRPVRTFAVLESILSTDFKLSRRRDIPFLIREHARKFQMGIAEASVWVRR